MGGKGCVLIWKGMSVGERMGDGVSLMGEGEVWVRIWGWVGLGVMDEGMGVMWEGRDE